MIRRIYILSFLSLILFISISVTSAYQFSNPMQLGSRGNDVAALQKFLVAKGYLIMPAGVAMGYFGSLTEAAVIKFQRDYPNETYLNANLTAPNGVAGRYTLNKINQLEAIGSVSGNTAANTPRTSLSPEDLKAISPYLPEGVRGFMDINGNVYTSPATPSPASSTSSKEVQDPPQTLAENLPKFTGKIKQILACHNTGNALIEFDREWWNTLGSAGYERNKGKLFPEALVTRPGTLQADGRVTQPGLPGVGACVDGFFVPKKDQNQQLCVDQNNQPYPSYISGTILNVLGGTGACNLNPIADNKQSQCKQVDNTTFGGPKDVRVSKDGYALTYGSYGKRGDFVETTTVGGTTYSWYYALDDSGFKIPYDQGTRSGHTSYFETLSVSRGHTRNASGLYTAYPLSGHSIPGLPNFGNTASDNAKLANCVVRVSTASGTSLDMKVVDRGPHSSRDCTLDVSPDAKNQIDALGGVSSYQLLCSN